MDFQQLECLIEVCKYNSFTRAANALFLSQSSISKNIAALEQELGISLLERTRHRVSPTKAGVYLAREAQRIVGEMSGAAEHAKQIASGKMGFLKIGVSDELDLNGLLPGFLSSFSRNFPEIEISISIHSYKELDNLILGGSLDVAFGPCRSVAGQCQDGLGSVLINRATPRLYYSCDHKNAGKDHVTAEDFCNDTYVALRNRFSKTLPMLKSVGIVFRNVIYVDSLQAMKLYVEANQGVTVLGESYSIINSTKVKSVLVNGVSEVGTDMIFKCAPSNESTILFRGELEKYLDRKRK